MGKLLGRKISNRTVDALAAGDRDGIYWDPELLGFGVRVYPSGAKVYVVQTRSGGRSRRITIGRHGVLSAARARQRAALVIARLKAGEEPTRPAAGAQWQGETSATVADLAERFLREHVAVRCKPWTLMSYRGALAKWILPALGRLEVAAVEHRHVAALHYRLRDLPYRANQVLAILNRMFSLAEVWGLRRDGNHPCRSVRRYPEHHRERFLSDEEFRRLGRVLDEMEAEWRDKPGGTVRASAVAAIRLLMLTGCRRDEILTLQWSDVDLEAGELHLPDSKTGGFFFSRPARSSRFLSRPCAA